MHETKPRPPCAGWHGQRGVFAALSVSSQTEDPASTGSQTPEVRCQQSALREHHDIRQVFRGVGYRTCAWYSIPQFEIFILHFALCILPSPRSRAPPGNAPSARLRLSSDPPRPRPRIPLTKRSLSAVWISDLRFALCILHFAFSPLLVPGLRLGTRHPPGSACLRIRLRRARGFPSRSGACPQYGLQI